MSGGGLELAPARGRRRRSVTRSVVLLLGAAILSSQAACAGLGGPAPVTTYVEVTGLEVKPRTRVLAAAISSQYCEVRPSYFPLGGSDTELVDASARLYVYDDDAKSLRLLAEIGPPSSDVTKFRCEIAGWAGDDVYAALRVWRKGVGEEVRYRRVEPDGAVTSVERPPANLVERETRFEDGGLAMSGLRAGNVALDYPTGPSRVVLNVVGGTTGLAVADRNGE